MLFTYAVNSIVELKHTPLTVSEILQDTQSGVCGVLGERVYVHTYVSIRLCNVYGGSRIPRVSPQGGLHSWYGDL